MPRLAAFPGGFLRDIVERRMTLLKWMALAGQLGVDGVEMDPRFFESPDSAYLRRLRQEAAARSLKIPMMRHSCDFAQADPAARAEEVRRTRKMLQVTAELGGRFCRVLPGPDRPGPDPEAGRRPVIDSLHELLPYAESTSVVLAIENDGEDARSRERYLAILEGVNSPWLRAQVDLSGAAAAGEGPPPDRVLPRVATLRVAARSLEEGATLDRVFPKLAAAGFDGWVILEGGEGGTVEQGLEHLRQGVRLLRSKLAQHFPRGT